MFTEMGLHYYVPNPYYQPGAYLWAYCYLSIVDHTVSATEVDYDN